MNLFEKIKKSFKIKYCITPDMEMVNESSLSYFNSDIFKSPEEILISQITIHKIACEKDLETLIKNLKEREDAERVLLFHKGKINAYEHIIKDIESRSNAFKNKEKEDIK
ncbi:MAG: hypothetical protein WBG30_13220 [Psychrilyobacter sp.]|uniref:hypothetical protein n=1 Tax=Psychrilyobacter sp. TaxID=2586924 RepID=UPI003C738B70